MGRASGKPTVAVIGAGPGGIAMGALLAEGGYEFRIFDRADGFGGADRLTGVAHLLHRRRNSAAEGKEQSQEGSAIRDH